MTNLPPSSKYLQRSEDAVDDTEREHLTRRLNDAFEDGRLDQETYMAKLETVYSAKNLGELVPVVEDLPAARDLVPTGAEMPKTVPAGELNQPRNLMVPALLVTGTLVSLLVILGILAIMIF